MSLRHYTLVVTDIEFFQRMPEQNVAQHATSVWQQRKGRKPKFNAYRVSRRPLMVE